MVSYVLRRLAYSVPIVLIASFVLFVAVRAAFDPLAKLRQNRDPAVIARETERLGLDRSVPEQYVLWAKGIVQGEWGTSSRTGQSVRSMIGEALWPTLQLVFWGLLFAVIIALAISVYSAVRRYTAGDHVLTGLSYLGIALPAFWVGLILIQVLAVGPRQRLGLEDPPLYF